MDKLIERILKASNYFGDQSIHPEKKLKHMAGFRSLYGDFLRSIKAKQDEIYKASAWLDRGDIAYDKKEEQLPWFQKELKDFARALWLKDLFEGKLLEFKSRKYEEEGEEKL